MMKVCNYLLCALLVGGLFVTPADARKTQIRWRFRTDGRTTKQFITQGPNGTIYTSDNRATYALLPTGKLFWESTESGAFDGGGGRPFSIGADGTIYTGVGIVGDRYALVVAFNPDGSVRWKFVPESPATLATGPNVGPDGNIYAVQEVPRWDGLGVFALDQAGNLLRSNQADFSAVLLPDTNSEIEFGPDRLYTGQTFLRSGSNPVIYAFSLGLDFLWHTYDLRPHVTNHPVTDPVSRVVATWGQTGMRTLLPNGTQDWFTLHPNGVSFVVRPSVDSAGNIYSGDLIGIDLWSLDPNGNTRWVLPPEPDTTLWQLGVSPDDRVLVACGSKGSDPWAGFVRGYDTATGRLRWEVNLPAENGMPQFVTSVEPAFSADARFAYVTTQFAGSVNNHGYVIAIWAQSAP